MALIGDLIYTILFAGAGATEEAVKLLRVWLTEMAHGQVPVDAKLPQSRYQRLQVYTANHLTNLDFATQSCECCNRLSIYLYDTTQWLYGFRLV